MNTTKTKPETRGRPKIYATVSERYKANNLRKKELHPEKYKANGCRPRPTSYCAVCDKTYSHAGFKPHFFRSRHIKAVAKQMEEQIENSTILEDNLTSFNEKLSQLPIVC